MNEFNKVAGYEINIQKAFFIFYKQQTTPKLN